MSPAPSVSNSFTVRLTIPARATAVSELTTLVEREGAIVTGIDVTGSGLDRLRVDLTALGTSPEHAEEVVEAMHELEGVKIGEVSDRTFLAHLGGKIKIESKAPIRNRDDLSLVYTPGVARVSTALAENPADARRLTIKGNTVAVVTDGTAVLGLGDLGPLGALPVMEGKAALFKRFADIDAFPICLDTTDTEEIIRTVKAISPVFGGINLEDISAPRCFEIERRLREELDIPVFHDDQHGTAVVALAALENALKVVGKKLADVRIVMSGAGAAGTAILKLFLRAGAKDVLVADVNGVLHLDREDVRDGHNAVLMWSALHTNKQGFRGSLKEALAGADVFVGVSAGNILTGDDIATMNEDAIVFAMANPLPEVDPVAASKHAKVVATGRSDFANQINNVLVFPAIFRGLLDAAASRITDDILLAAAEALAGVVKPDELNPTYIIPSAFHPDVTKVVAEAIRDAAEAGHVAREVRNPDDED
ncbi:MAG: NAD-dependent malic enzyme [Micrococcales bacterium]|nr:NAD-dependent malic enzyme [Micrococcales bacterium]